MTSRRRTSSSNVTAARSATALFLLASVAGTLGLLAGCVDDSISPIVPVADSGARDAGGDATTDARAPTSDAGVDGESDAAMAFGRIEGTVLDFASLEIGVIAGATVSTTVGSATITATSDDDGHFVLENVPAGVALVRVTKATNTDHTNGAYSSQTLPTLVRKDATSQLFPRLHRGCQLLSDVAEGTEDQLYLDGICADRPDTYLSITYPSDAFVTAAGGTFAGVLRTEVIPIAFPYQGALGVAAMPTTDLSWSLGFPGTGVGLTKAGAPTGVEALAAVEIRFVDDGTGEPVALGTGKKVTLSIERYRDADEGETFTAWHFDPARGVWVDTTTTTLGEASPVESDRIFSVATVEIDSAGWWLAAKPIVTTTCVRGTVKAPDGTALAGADLRAVGLFDLVSSNTLSDSTGAFCVDVKASAAVDGGVVADAGDTAATVELRGTASPAAGIRSVGRLPLTAPTAAGSCLTNAAACTDYGVLTLTPTTMTCVRGTAKLRVPGDGGDGEMVETPLADKLPVTAQLGELVTYGQQQVGMTTQAYVGTLKPGAAGAFCMPLPPADQYVVGGSTSALCQAQYTLSGSFFVEGVNASSTSGSGIGGSCSSSAGDRDGGCATVPNVLIGCTD